VDEILFSGVEAADVDELLDIMSTKESGLLSSPAFVERKLLLDLERIKLYYWLEGWQDIYDTTDGERVILASLDFSEDRAEVDIRIHVREPARYSVKSVDIQGNTIFSRERILEWLPMKAGEPASERQAGEYLKIVQSRYQEQGYILARINHEWVQDNPDDENQLALRVRIVEGQKMRIGRIDVTSNSRTKDEVVRRELRDFAPGEWYNMDKLERGINRLYDAQYFTYGTIKFWHEDPDPGSPEGTRDVKIEVKEGNTGSVRLLGGYSSSFGFLGIFELTQRNFDITDTPETFGELLSGDAFVGAGQIFRLRVMPAQRRQSYSAEFREPYLFGEPVGVTLRGYDVLTQRRSWDEETIGGNVTFDKRWDNLIVELGLTGFEITIDEVERDAPRIVRRESGSRVLTSFTPGVRYDDRDSASIPTEGFLGETSVELATEPGDFDFYRWEMGAEYHLVLYEAEERKRLSRHVLSSRIDLGYAQPYGQSDDIPIFRRFFAGGRGSIRGYEFRGVGPHEGDDPVGGKVLAAATLEYSMPLFVDFLRGAAFFDAGTVANQLSDVGGAGGEFRYSAGLGLRVIIPFLGNTPVALDFGFPLNEVDGDDEQLITFDVGRLF
jgi:outer membrane protein assembly complex protein YaeT